MVAMLGHNFVAALGLAFVAVAQNVSNPFEPANFNITKALIGYGINVSAIPSLNAFTERSSTVACSITCTYLTTIFGPNAVETQGATSYANYTSSYWSLLQADVDPYCIFLPSSEIEVSVLVLLSRLTQCPFAAKSGGHAAFAGASSIQGGITVSFKNMNSIKLSEDATTAAVQPGNTWATVYETLAPYDLTVLGGRVSAIGVGGLTLGGGISFFSNIYGWASDNVASYDVVTASGAIVTATPNDYSDLYWALRGGGNNFGLVVNFHLNTIPLPGAEMWGGTREYTEDTFPAVIDAFVDLVADSPSDPNAGIWVAWIDYEGTKLASTELWYANPNGGNAAIFDNVNNISAISDTTQPRKLPAYTLEINEDNPNGYRELYYEVTVKASSEIATAALDIFWDEIGVAANVSGANPVMIWQGISEGELQAMTKNGGNPLGLTVEDGPYYIVHISCWWDNEEDDATIYQMVSTILSKVKAEATTLRVQTDYVYMNYASQYQDVISSYGADNKAKLKSIASKYDPTAVFQRLQPGYFKLDRAPIPDSEYFSY